MKRGSILDSVLDDDKIVYHIKIWKVLAIYLFYVQNSEEDAYKCVS